MHHVKLQLVCVSDRLNLVQASLPGTKQSTAEHLVVLLLDGRTGYLPPLGSPLEFVPPHLYDV